MEQVDREKLPNFFICGAAKSGTTTLWKYLKQHPQIFMPEDMINKEPGYFCENWGVKDYSRYLKIFKNADSNHTRIGEATTGYLTDPSSARRIKEYALKNNLDVKIIIMLRNPIDRAYSLYRWNVQEGYEYANSFEQALKLEKDRIKKMKRSFWTPGGFIQNYFYFKSGLYYEQVKRYRDTFGTDKVKVIIFEKFVEKPEKYLKDIFNFMSIKDIRIEVINIAENPSKLVLSSYLQFTLRYLIRFMLKIRLINRESKSKRDYLLKIGLVKGDVPVLDRKARKHLSSAYEHDKKRLEELLNFSINEWHDFL